MSKGTFSNNNEIHKKCINTIRTLAMDAIQKANSGHPGAPMGLCCLCSLDRHYEP